MHDLIDMSGREAKAAPLEDIHHPRILGQDLCDELLDKAKAKAPARSLISIDDVGVATAFLAHDAARLITGETLYIDGGYHIMD